MVKQVHLLKQVPMLWLMYLDSVFLCKTIICLGLSGSLGFPSGSDGKESTCNVGDLGLILGLGRSSGEGKGNPL